MVLYPAGLFRSHGHRFRTAIRSSFSVVPKKCKNIFWEFFLNKRERGGSSPCITRLCVLHSYTQAHCKPGTCSKPLAGSVHTHRLFLPLLTLPCSSQGNVLQAPPGRFLSGAWCSCRNRAMVPGKMTAQTFPNSPSTDGTLLNTFPAHKIPACHIPLPPQSG